MKLRLLGINGPFPESGGFTSGYLLEAGNQMLQLDFGSGVLSRLTAVFPPEDLSAILISYLSERAVSFTPPLRIVKRKCPNSNPFYKNFSEIHHFLFFS